MPHLGKFYVPEDLQGDDAPTLRAAQEGCAVLRCEYLSFMRMFEVTAYHPDFDVVSRERFAPEYECIFTRGVGGVIVRRFKRKP